MTPIIILIILIIVITTEKGEKTLGSHSNPLSKTEPNLRDLEQDRRKLHRSLRGTNMEPSRTKGSHLATARKQKRILIPAAGVLDSQAGDFRHAPI